MKKNIFKLILKIAIAVALLFFLYRQVSTQDIFNHLSAIQLAPVFIFFCLLFVNTFISTLKWKLLLDADSVKIPLPHLFASYLIGSFFNLFLPSTIGGDAYRVFSIKQYSSKFSKSFASVFADRLTGFFALSVLGLIFSIIGFETLPHHLCFLVPLVVCLGIMGIAVAIIYRPLFMWFVRLFRLDRIAVVSRAIDKVLNSFETYSRNSPLLYKTIGLSFLFQFILIVCIFILSKALRLNLGLESFFVFVPIITILETIPISIYGLGLRDMGYVFFFSEMDLANPQSLALSMSVLYVGITLLYCSIGGLLFVIRLFYFNRSRVETHHMPRYSAGGNWNDGRSLTIGVMLRHINERGGINVYSRNMLFTLPKMDPHNQYIFFTPTPTFHGKLRQFPNVREIVVEAGTLPMRKLTWDQYHVLSPLGKYKVDVVFNPKLSIPLMAHCKTAFTMHGMEQFEAKRLFMWQDRLYYMMAMKLYTTRADAILVMTQTGKTDLQKHLNVRADKIHIIPESYNEKCRRVTSPEDVNQIRSIWALPEKYLLFVGGITPLKNIPTLLRAYKILKDKGYPHKLVIVGFRRWNFAKDVALIEELGLQDDVIELGFVEDAELPGLYSLADCFILPSFYEGFGIPILEAQACGCPVVISDVGGMPEVAGEGALKFKPTQPAELAERIETILNQESLRYTLVQKGLENVKRYSWEETARRTVDLFNWLGRVP